MPTYPVRWIAVALPTVVLQIALGTDPVFASLSLVIFLAFPFVYAQFRAIDSVGSVLVLTTFAKLFIVSQWVKIAFLQPADTHLDAPLETAAVILLALLGFALAAVVLKPILARRRFRLFEASHDPDFMLRIGLAALGLAVVGVVMRYRLGMDKLADPGIIDTEEMRGRGMVLWNYFASLLPFAAAVFTARCLLISDGRRIADGYVALSITVCLAAGMWANSRTDMFVGIVAAYVTYLSYGGTVKTGHILAGVFAAVFTQVIVFPLIDIQRSLPGGLTPTEYVSETLRLSWQILDSADREQLYARHLQSMYEGWTSRQYYGTPQGMLDRFTPSQVDEVIAYVTDRAPFGLDYLFYPLTRLVPPVLLGQFGLEHPLMGGRLLETHIWLHDRFTNPNYGIIPEIYSYTGIYIFPFAFPFVIFVFFLTIHIIYGGLRRNYFGSFCASIYLFTLADGDAGEMVGRTLEQVIVYAALYQAARLAWERRPRVQAALR